MKCDNCGNEYKNSLTCPLCGHRQGKVSYCPVCKTIIHYGQSRCSNCGNPTKYEKKVDINKNYTSSFNNNSNSYTTSNENNHVYKQQEKHDYKSSDLDIKQHFEAVRKNLNKFQYPLNNKINIKGEKLRNIIVALVVLISGTLIITSQFFRGSRDNIQYVDPSQMEVLKENDNITSQGNYKNGGYVYMNEDDVYLGMDYNVYQTGWTLDEIAPLVDEGDNYIYTDGNYLYYNRYNMYTRYDIENDSYKELFEINNVSSIGDNMFLYTNYDEDGLFLYDGVNNESTILIDENVFEYTYDLENNLVYYINDQPNYIYAIDLLGNKVSEYNISIGDQLYVNGDNIYYRDFQGVHLYNTVSESDDLIVEDEVDKYIVAGDAIIYTNYDGELYSDDGSRTLIDREVTVFNVIGNLIVYSVGDGDSYLENWYVSGFYGDNIAKLNNYE